MIFSVFKNLALAKITTKRLKMALSLRVDENRVPRTCMQTFGEPADKIDRLTLIHLRLLMHVKKCRK